MAVRDRRERYDHENLEDVMKDEEKVKVVWAFKIESFKKGKTYSF